TLQELQIGGSIQGGTATADGQDLTKSGSVSVRDDLVEMTLNGSLIGGDSGGFAVTSLFGSGAIDVEGRLGTLVIAGDILGREQRARVVAGGLTMFGKVLNPAIRSLTVLGRVENADVLA